ncbi:unnamed protein product [Rotaria sordida]|uniref:Uncharacterized protein n=1 Tax=Rotaria sordida TaxID=392033 RepID=A0A814DV38_9BILA|nr:unnamed protein product [Rotaria sordida]CAF0962156.1 unnamed protein product [Rotaria sordida]CAF0983563.1 unnamed protein product [Rotaria sordida]CAF1039652.1 unnamed protein product [Rotaria sordida]CAF1040063.1 unnamed protein product [Rotaria sordida]
MFGKKASIPEQAKAHSRELRKTDRELVRDRHRLEAEEQRILNEIRKNASTGNRKAVEVLAKQLVKLRNQKAQSLQASGQIQGLATQNTMMASNLRMANAMQATAKTMTKMNKVMNPAQMSKITQQFTQEHTKLGIKEEMMGETLDAAFGEEGDSEEEDAIVNQVLDEIGITFNEKMAVAPRVPAATSGMVLNRRQAHDEDAEIERMLANLKS